MDRGGRRRLQKHDMEEYPLEKQMENSGMSCPIGNGTCNYRQGTLPQCGMLAVGYVPRQAAATPAYDTGDALKRGTLFPGLDLPFMNMVNTKDVTDTPLGEVMGLCFVSHELQLYLDTHPDDTEAFQTLKEMLALTAEAKRRYVAKYGPLVPADLQESETFDWLADPWPWAYDK